MIARRITKIHFLTRCCYTLTLAVTAATVLAVWTSVLAVIGEVSSPWHHLVLTVWLLTLFSLIAAVCTLICVTVVRQCARKVFDDLSSMREQLASSRMEILDATSMSQMSAQMRRRDDR